MLYEPPSLRKKVDLHLAEAKAAIMRSFSGTVNDKKVYHAGNSISGVVKLVQG
jgi:hypothetical protein